MKNRGREERKSFEGKIVLDGWGRTDEGGRKRRGDGVLNRNFTPTKNFHLCLPLTSFLSVSTTYIRLWWPKAIRISIEIEKLRLQGISKENFRLCRSSRHKHFVPVYWSFAVSYADRHCPSTYHYLPCSSPVYPFVVEKLGAITSHSTQLRLSVDDGSLSWNIPQTPTPHPTPPSSSHPATTNLNSINIGNHWLMNLCLWVYFHWWFMFSFSIEYEWFSLKRWHEWGDCV